MQALGNSKIKATENHGTPDDVVMQLVDALRDQIKYFKEEFANRDATIKYLRDVMMKTEEWDRQVKDLRKAQTEFEEKVDIIIDLSKKHDKYAKEFWDLIQDKLEKTPRKRRT